MDQTRKLSIKLIAIILTILCFAPAVLHAQAGQNLTINISPGFDGHYKPGRWVPIAVTVDNRKSDPGSDRGDDFTGRLEMRVTSNGHDRKSFRFVQDIQVPFSSVQRYILMVKLPDLIPGRSEMPQLELRGENGKLISQSPVDVTMLGADRTLMVIVGDQLSNPSFPFVRGGDYSIKSRMSTRGLPTHWSELDCVDILVFTKWPDNGIPAPQLKAITDWVATGGTLVFLTGSNTPSYVGEAAEQILPAALDGTARLIESQGGTFSITEAVGGDIPAEQRNFLFARASPKSGTRILSSISGMPMAMMDQLGNGQIVLFSVDLESVSAELERHLGIGWNAIAPLPNLTSPEYSFSRMMGKFQTLTGRAARPPNYILIILICIIYTLAVGPLNFTLLAKRQKLEWAWLTVPAIVVVFTGLIYGLGSLTKGGEAISRQVVVKDYSADDRTGTEKIMTGVFVPSQGDYYFRPEDQYRTLASETEWAKPPNFRQSYFSPVDTGAALFREDPVLTTDFRQDKVYVDRWPMAPYDAATFQTRGALTQAPGIENNLYWGDHSIGGAVNNRSGVNYEQAYLLAGLYIYPLGDLPAGGSVTLDPGQYFPYAAEQRDTKWQRASYLFDSFITLNPETAEEVNMTNLGVYMGSYFDVPNVANNLPPMSGEVYFIGYAQSPGIRVESNLEPEVTSRLDLTMARLNILPLPGQSFRAVFPGTLKVRLTEFTDTGQFEFAENSIVMREATAVMAAELPFSGQKIAVDSFSIRFDLEDDDPVLKSEITLQVYSNATKQWTKIQPGMEIPNGPLYCLPQTGRLLFRIVHPPRVAGAKITSLLIAMNGRRR